MALTVVRVHSVTDESFDAFDGRRTTPQELWGIAVENPATPVLVEAKNGEDGTMVVTANCAAKNMDWIDTSRGPENERREGIHFETNLPRRDDSVWAYVLGYD